MVGDGGVPSPPAVGHAPRSVLVVHSADLRGLLANTRRWLRRYRSPESWAHYHVYMRILAKSNGGMAGTSGPLAEYEALRTHILQLESEQLIIYNFHLTTSGGLFIFAFSQPRLMFALLIVSPATYFQFGRFCALGVDILLASQYIRNELAGRVPGGLGWEEWRVRRRPLTAWGPTILLSYHGVSLLALTTSVVLVFTKTERPTWAITAGTFLAAAFLILTTLMRIRYHRVVKELLTT